MTTATSTVNCRQCGAPTRVDPSRAAHVCEYCDGAFHLRATHAAEGAAERLVAERLEAHEAELEQHFEQALASGRQGDEATAWAHLQARARLLDAAYRDSGYYAALGLNTPPEIDAHWQRVIEGEMACVRHDRDTDHLRAADSPVARLGSAIAARDLDTVVAAYREVLALKDPQRQYDHDAWVRHLLEGIDWAAPDQLARYGIVLAVAELQPDGTLAFACAACGARGSAPRLTESTACRFCGATQRLRLTGVDVYHARGYTDVTQADVARQEAANHAAGGHDLDAAFETAKGTVASMGAAPESGKYRGLLYYYAAQMFPWVGSERQAEALARLRLEPPRRCRQCEEMMALPVEGPKRCPLCDGGM